MVLVGMGCEELVCTAVEFLSVFRGCSLCFRLSQEVEGPFLGFVSLEIIPI